MSEETDDRAAILETGTRYRMAYGLARNRLERAAYTSDSAPAIEAAERELVRELDAGALRLDAFHLGRRMPVDETVKEAVEDAIAGRKPRW